MYGYIYLTTNKINGKQYVGQKQSDTFVKSYKGSGKALLKAFKKYGKENFECHIIDTAETQEELNDKEFVYVELYQTIETGYNLCEGGGSVSGYKHTEDSKQKIGEAVKIRWEDPEYKQKLSEAHTGKQHTEEWKQKMSENLVGENNPMYGKGFLIAGEKHPMYGKQHTEKSKQKMSEAQTGEKNGMYGKHHTEETKKKLSEAKKGKQTGSKNGMSKKCIFRDKEFSCIKDARTYAKSLGVSRNNFMKELIIL